MIEGLCDLVQGSAGVCVVTHTNSKTRKSKTIVSTHRISRRGHAWRSIITVRPRCIECRRRDARRLQRHREWQDASFKPERLMILRYCGNYPHCPLPAARRASRGGPAHAGRIVSFRDDLGLPGGRPAHLAQRFSLSPRIHQTLQHLLAGLSEKQIASKLHLPAPIRCIVREIHPQTFQRLQPKRVAGAAGWENSRGASAEIGIPGFGFRIPDFIARPATSSTSPFRPKCGGHALHAGAEESSAAIFTRSVRRLVASRTIPKKSVPTTDSTTAVAHTGQERKKGHGVGIRNQRVGAIANARGGIKRFRRTIFQVISRRYCGVDHREYYKPEPSGFRAGWAGHGSRSPGAG